jgi:DNA-binding ferritin-like protein (Dps family)
LQGLEDQNRLLKEQKQLSIDSFNEVFKKLQAESFISGEGTKKKRGSILTGIVGLFSGRTEVTQQLQSLVGKSFEEIEKLFLSNQLTDKAKVLFEQLQKLKQEGVDIDALLDENAQKAREAFTGTTADSIVDSIAEGFLQGKNSAADFADNFQDLMRNAIIQSLKLKFLEEPLKDFFTEFADFSQSGGQLTSGEIKDLKALYDSIITNANAQFDQLQQISGLNINAQSSQGNSLTGAIKGITEQQADLLAGQFGGLRLTALDQLNVSRSSLNALNQIEANTGLTQVKLQRLIEKFDSYETGARKIKVEI